MIQLDFRNIESWSYEFSDNPDEWVAELGGAFFGTQVFKIDDADFSGDYPILGFAHFLNVIIDYLQETGMNAFYVDPEFEKQSRTEFYREGDLVIVKEVNWRTNAVLHSVSVPHSELAHSAKAYLERVFRHCCELAPQLRENEGVHDWLKSRFVPAPCLPFKREPIKPAKTVRIGFDS